MHWSGHATHGRPEPPPAPQQADEQAARSEDPTWAAVWTSQRHYTERSFGTARTATVIELTADQIGGQIGGRRAVIRALADR